MPFLLFVLASAVFAQATSEFMLAGLVPAIAAGLHVPVAAAGALTSAFAVGMVVGAPATAVLARRFPPRAALLAFLAVFVVVHVAGALTTSYGVLLATRVVAAVANAGFLAVALAVAVRVAPPGGTTRATATLLAGTTLACIAGVPGGALLGQALGWRAVYWAVAALCVPAVVGVLHGVPATVTAGPVGPVRGELKALRRPALVTVLAVGALVNGATFCAYTFLAPLLTGPAGLGPGWIPVGLALFGLGSFAGVTLAGRAGDGRLRLVVGAGGPVLAAGWAALALAAGRPAVTLVLVGVLGLLAFGVGSSLVAAVVLLAPDAPTLGGCYATVALNVGATAGPVLGGIALDASASARAPACTSAALVVLALLVFAAAAAGRPRVPAT